mgnify:FL=1
MAVQELFRANKRESAVDFVVNNIKKLLVEQKLKPGDRLPNEVEISEAMNVSRGSVREALRILTAFGLVESRVGTGTYICQKPGRTLADSLLFSFFVNNPNIGKLYEFRRLIEIDILESVLDHYDENEEERRMLEENVDELRELITKNPDTDWLRENDIHCLMGVCTKNVLMERIYGIVIDFMKASIAETLKNQHGEIVYKEHMQILEVIRTRDYSRIEEVITSSVDTWSMRQAEG